MKLTAIALLSIAILLGAAAFQLTDSSAQNGLWPTRTPTVTQRPLPSLWVTIVPPQETATERPLPTIWLTIVPPQITATPTPK